MFGVNNFELFILSTIIFIITPGMDTIFVLNKAIGQGKKAGMFSTFGVNAGILVHTIFAMVGLSIIIGKSAMAFMIIKYVGALYLVYLGLVSLLSEGNKINLINGLTGTDSGWSNFKSGLITNVLNPKVALFFISFFPQFINPKELGSVVPFIFLGSCYAIMGLIWYSILVYFLSAFSNRLKDNPKFTMYLSKFYGLVFVLMGLKVAMEKK